MAGYPLPQFDPTQQLNQDPTQGQSPGSQPPPQQAQQGPQQPPPSQAQDPLEPIAQGLAQRIGQYQQQQNAPANNGGAIKRLLGNFLSGAGSSMMHDAGLPTPFEQNQRDIQNLNTIRTTQSGAQLHQAMAGMYGTVPYQVPDATSPTGFTTINVMQKDVAALEKARMAAAARTGAAGITAQGGIERARIMTGPPVTASPEMQQMGLPPTLPLRFANQAQQLLTRPLETVQGANGPSQVNKLNPTAPPTQFPVGNPRSMFAPANRYGEFVDPNNPDVVRPMTFGQAAQQGATSPQSVGFQANKAITKSATSGPIGNEINAQQTAIQHATLLQQAVSALGNGDTQALNKLKNSFATQFGATGPITAQTIANAYGREVTKMLTSGHMTDAEISSAGGTLDVSRMSPAQMGSVIGAYKALAASKMQMRQQQVERGKQGQANFPPSVSGPQSTPSTGGKMSVSDWLKSQGR